MLIPDVIGFRVSGQLREGVTTTDLALTVTQMLRKKGVVGKFVEFFGPGLDPMPLSDRATIANMAPEYDATVGFFPVDEKTLEYFRSTGRSDELVNAIRTYYEAQGMFGIPRAGECQYSQLIELNLAEIEPSVSGPKRPQDRIELTDLKERFNELLQKPVRENGYNKQKEELDTRFPVNLSATTATATTAGGNGRSLPVLAGGGMQDTDTVPQGEGNMSAKNTSALTEIEMMNNRPTPDRVEHDDKDASKQPEVQR